MWGDTTQLEEGERLDGRSLLFEELAVQRCYRDADSRKPQICLIDGEESLWRLRRNGGRLGQNQKVRLPRRAKRTAVSGFRMLPPSRICKSGVSSNQGVTAML